MSGSGTKGNIVGQRDDVPSNDIENLSTGPTRITPKRALHVNLRDNSGSEIASSNPLPVAGAVTVSSLPLPTGAATSSNQVSTNSKLDTLIAGVNTELPSAAALADATANPTAPAVAAHAMGLNALGTWDRAKLGTVFDLDSGAGTQNVAGVSLRKTASGGSVELGTVSDPVQIKQDATQLATLATAAKQDTGNASLATIAAKDFATSSKQDTQAQEIRELQDILNIISSAIQAIAGAKGVAADLRTTLLSGVLTSCSTVSTVTSLSQLSGYSTALIPWAQSNQAAIQSNINNVVVS